MATIATDVVPANRGCIMYMHVAANQKTLSHASLLPGIQQTKAVTPSMYHGG